MSRRHARNMVVAAVASVAIASLSGIGQAEAPAAKVGGTPAVAARLVPMAVAPIWTKLSVGAGINVSTGPGVVRWGSKLLVTWKQGPGSVKARLLDAAARPVGAVSSVVSGWSEIDADARPFILSGAPAVAFSGNHSLSPTDPYDGPVVYARSGTGAAWSLGSGALTQSATGTGDDGIGAVQVAAGDPVTVYSGGGSRHLAIHHGIGPGVPAATADVSTPSLGETQFVNVARDAKSGVVYAAYYSGLSNSTQGIHAIGVYPNISAPSPAAPGSVYTVDGSATSNVPGQFVALASRTVGGVWAAYAAGHGASSALVLWNVQTHRALVLHRPGLNLQYVNLSPGPGGRLWVSWVQGSTVLATRTNPAVTAFGVVRALGAPGGSPTRTAGDGVLGPLDEVINVTNGAAAPAIYSARILEGLRVSASPARVSYDLGGTVTVSVTDAGLPVPGVTVRVGSVLKLTNAAGRATFTVAKHSVKGAHAVSASRTGWWPGASAFRVA